MKVTNRSDIYGRREASLLFDEAQRGFPESEAYSDREAYSVAGEIGFGWWLVEHYSAYHVNCPDGCGLGEPARGG